MKRGHYCNCHKERDKDNFCHCSICHKLLGLYGELYQVKYQRTKHAPFPISNTLTVAHIKKAIVVLEKNNHKGEDYILTADAIRRGRKLAKLIEKEDK